MDWDESEIIDSNGQKYRVGWDEFGWFSIQRVEPHLTEDRYVPETDEDGMKFPLTSFTPDGAETVRELIEER